MEDIKILSLNCRGLGSSKKRRDVLHYLKNMNYDIYFLQDTHLTDRKEPLLSSVWRGKSYHSFGTFNSRGTSILINPQLQHDIIYEEKCKKGDFILSVIKIHGNTYTLLNIYGPNEDRPSFFLHLKEQLSKLSCENLIIAGDFNFVMDFKLDSNYRRQNNPGARDAFAQIVEEENLSDIWRQMNPSKRAFTWTKLNPYKFGRLDMFFIGDHLIDNVLSSSILPGYRSDHSIVTVHLRTPQKKRGPGVWKFNSSLLKDEQYEKVIKELVTDTVRQYAIPIYRSDFVADRTHFDEIQFTITSHLFYETLIMLLRGETVRFSKRKARMVREEEGNISAEISRIREELTNNPNPEKLQCLEEAQQRLEDIRRPKIEGLITRSRVNWYEEGEKCTKYFLSLEKRNAVRNSIQSLRVSDSIITDKTEILTYFSQNLKEKYLKTDTASPSSYLSRNIRQKLTEDEKKELDEPITKSELKSALMNMKKGKTPGSNGFTADFFKHFWDLLGDFLFRAWKERFKTNKNINSHNESIVTLIPKAGASHDAPKGWRPISLLNVDFKIISAAVANRLKKVMSNIIAPSQTAYIQGRFIGENSRLTYDVIEHLNCEERSGIVTGIDFEAAFDTVSWEFLLEALKEYNFGEYFQKLITVLYLNSDVNSRILIDGNLGAKIFMERGIRQGDPASGYLFNLVIEPLANQLKCSNNIEGIRISDKTEVRVSQYADDLILFSSPKIHSIQGILEELSQFSKVSGLKVNLQKTKCLPIGNNVPTEQLKTLGLSVVNDLKILGIHYHKTNDNIASINIQTIIPKIKKEICQWRRRQLTLLGKITVVKSLLVSKLVHVLTALPNPSEATIKELNSILFRFIWNEGPDKVKRTTLITDYHEGGLRMLDIHSFLVSLKISWLKRLYWAPANVTWANLARENLPVLEDLVCFSSIKLAQIARGLKNNFWKEVVLAWASFSRAYKPSDKEILTDYIWFSDNTKFKKSFVREWNEKGIRFISDFFNAGDGSLLSKDHLMSIFKIKMTFLCYASIVRSLPSSIMSNSENRDREIAHPILPYKIALLSTKTQLNRIVYSTLVKAIKTRRSSELFKLESKWNRDVGQVFLGSLRDVRSATRNTYLQTLHYRIVNRIIATNSFLCRIGKTDDASCALCGCDIESLMHAFYSCNIVQSFIGELKRYVHEKYDITLITTAGCWFFPRHDSELSINILIKTVAKHTILRSKTLKRPPNIHLFTSLLAAEALKEKGAALKSRCYNKFENKWGNVINILQDTHIPPTDRSSFPSTSGPS